MSKFAGLSYYLHLRMTRIDVFSFAVSVVAKFVVAEFIEAKCSPIIKEPIAVHFESYAIQVV